MKVTNCGNLSFSDAPHVLSLYLSWAYVYIVQGVRLIINMSNTSGPQQCITNVADSVVPDYCSSMQM